MIIFAQRATRRGYHESHVVCTLVVRAATRTDKADIHSVFQRFGEVTRIFVQSDGRRLDIDLRATATFKSSLAKSLVVHSNSATNRCLCSLFISLDKCFSINPRVPTLFISLSSVSQYQLNSPTVLVGYLLTQ